nr:MAG TPA: hypothetical protein [Caudoviricetes sp.]
MFSLRKQAKTLGFKPFSASFLGFSYRAEDGS